MVWLHHITQLTEKGVIGDTNHGLQVASFREASTSKGRGTTLTLFKRNLHSLGVPVLICGGSVCLFLRQPRDSNTTLLPVIEFFKSYPVMQAFKQ